MIFRNVNDGSVVFKIPDSNIISYEINEHTIDNHFYCHYYDVCFTFISNSQTMNFLDYWYREHLQSMNSTQTSTNTTNSKFLKFDIL